MAGPFAHTGRNDSEDRASWHLLRDHLLGVGELAEAFASLLGPGAQALSIPARWAGMLHDLGKYRVEFQDYLQKKRGKSLETQHAVFGAAYAWNHFDHRVALAILGHHAGLPDWSDAQNKL